MTSACREIHGVHLRAGCKSRPQIVRETDDKIIISTGVIDIELGAGSARHLAKTLYRLARRLEKRSTSGIEARSDETATQAQPAGRGPGPQGDAQ